jgi:hypothetical protein
MNNHVPHGKIVGRQADMESGWQPVFFSVKE